MDGYGMLRLGVVVTVAAAVMPGCGPRTAVGVKIRAENAWTRPAVTETARHEGGGAQAGGASAIYLTLVNEGQEDDRLITVWTDVARRAEIHATKTEDGVTTMYHLPELVVPARGRVELRPGGVHLMLVGVTRNLNAGDRFQVALRFEKAGTLRVDVEVR
jgi:copper(I)-binding protein